MTTANHNPELEIVFRDEFLIAINKPAGLLVHRSPIASDAETFAVQQLRDQISRKVYPVHRLDRKTSGVLLFALEPEISSSVQQQFAEQLVKKTYLAIVRGWTEAIGTIDYPLTNDRGKEQEACTQYRTLRQAEIPVPSGKHSTSRYALLEIRPETGRHHQIRKHLAHIFHPILGDRPHGCNKQNRMWKERFGLTEMMLHAQCLSLTHPVDHSWIEIKATPGSTFQQVLKILFDTDWSKDP